MHKVVFFAYMSKTRSKLPKKIRDKELEETVKKEKRERPKFIKPNEKNTMLDSHRAFVNEYFKNGFNAKRAYMAISPNIDERSAEVNASKLLRNAKVRELIERKQEVNEIDDDYVLKMMKAYVKNGVSNPKFANAGAKAVELLGKTRGMLTDTKKIVFDANNPAVFVSPMTKDEAEALAKTGRITE